MRPTSCALGLLLLGSFLVACGTASQREDGADAAAPVDASSRADVSAPRDAAPPVPPPADAAEADVGAPSGSDAGASDSGADASTVLLPAVTSCAPTAAACGLPAVDAAFATYRKDAYLPSSAYAEQGADPTNGGRFHIAATAAVSGDVTGLLIDGTSADTLVGREPKLEWYHVWPSKVTAGQPVWIAFHSQDPAWDTASTLSVVVQTSGGDAVTATLPVAKAAAPITYVTTADDGATLIVHVHNDDASPHTLARLVALGADVTTAACIPSRTLAPGASAMWTVPLCAKAQPGAPWTVVADWADAAPSVAVGRVTPERFFVESWVSSSDCAFPGANATAYAAHQAAGFDTHYLYWGPSSCGFGGADIVNVRAPAEKDFFVLLGDDFLAQPSAGTLITDTSRVTGFLVGDEVDGKVWDNGHANPQDQAAKADQLWSMYPGIPVYQGAKTNKNVGAFAGSTDVQGEDFYVAACAPHITQWGTHPPLRGAYDYLRNARNNQMPLPSWLYAQGVSGGWDRKQAVTNAPIWIQPAPLEILVQAVSAIAAGAKGLMWFQSSQEDAAALPDTWAAIGHANWATRGVRALLREGDPTGLATASGAAIAEAIRARDAIVIPVVSLATSSGPTDTACAAAQVGLGAVPHWVGATQAVDVSVAVPDDFVVADAFEVSIATDSVGSPAVPPAVVGRTITFHAMPFDGVTPARLLVLARTTALRADVASRLHR